MKYNSPKYYNQDTTVHRLLSNIEVCVCARMETELTVTQDRGPIRCEGDRAVMKIEETDGVLHLYIPIDEDDIESCFETELPGELVRILGIEDRGAAKVIFRIINSTGKGLDAVMKDEDLSGYPWIEKPSQPPQLTQQWSPSNTNGTSGYILTSNEASTDDQDPVTVTALPTDSFRGVHEEEPRQPPQLASQGPIWQQAVRDELYRRFLQEVQRQARRTPSDEVGLLSLQGIEDALGELESRPDYDRFRQTFGRSIHGGLEENAWAGAAGELFVGFIDWTLSNDS